MAGQSKISFSQWLIIGLCLLFSFHVRSQADCNQTYASIFGSPLTDENGSSVALSLDQSTLYVGGVKNDSALILKVDQEGSIIWSKTFDIVTNQPDYVYRILVDSDGMLAVSGIAGTPAGGGTVFVFRYDPVNESMLWAKEIISVSTNYNAGICELGPGGNYIVSNNTATPNNAELIEINKNTGSTVNTFCKHYDLGSSETLADMVFYNGQLFWCGRFSDGPSTAQMRNTLVRMRSDNGAISWAKLGHKPMSVTARLYGIDIAIARDTIYSLIWGDENGTSITDTKIYVQKTTLDGTLIWLKQYEFPGTNDYVDEIVHADNGLVVMGRNRFAPSNIILFKIDYAGNVRWGKQYDYSNNDNSINVGGIQSQMIASADHLYFTAFAEETGMDMILVKTDLNGVISDTCASTQTLNIPVKTIANPTFYPVATIVTTYIPQIRNLSPKEKNINIPRRNICSVSMIETMQDSVICQGRTVDGYDASGIYVDTLSSANGCDSIRTLNLTVLPSPVTTLNIQLCEGETYEGYGTSGNYTDTYLTAGGCDSTRTLMLNVLNIPMTMESKSICMGDSYLGYTLSGTYIDTFVSMLGCDSIRILSLTTQDVLQETLNSSICFGQQMEGYTSAGIYMDTFSSVFGCDSIRTLQLEIIPAVTSYVEVSICDEAIAGIIEPGIYVDTLISAGGCDSIRTINVTMTNRYIPNVFSPNGDQVNDVFEIFYFPEDGAQVEYFAIFDRFGNMAYERKDIAISWDGKDKNGKYYNPGVFTYVLKSHCAGKSVIEHGTITLIR